MDKKEAKKLILEDYTHLFDIDYAKNNIKNFVIKNRSNGRQCSCSRCGGKVENDSINVCPHCNAQLIKFDSSYISGRYHYLLVSTIQEINGALLLRNYEVKYLVELNKPAQIAIYETMRNIVTESFSICARKSVTAYGWYTWGFRYDSNLKVYKYNEKHDLIPHKVITSLSSDRYKYCNFDYSVESSIYKQLQKSFMNTYHYVFSLKEYVEMVLYAKQMEFLFKKNRVDVIPYYHRNRHYERQYVKYVNSNLQCDALRFTTHLDNLEYLGMDIQNPKLYLVDSLEMEKIQKRCDKKRDRIRAEKQRASDLEKIEREKELAEEYVKRVADLLDLDLGNENYEIKILRDVPEFMEVGTEMHNCVFSAGYYKSASSFIFKIVDRDSLDIVELCELKKEDEKLFIKQCYGHCNKKTPEHNDIVNLINNNIEMLQERI